MSALRPSAGQERWLALAARMAELDRSEVLSPQRTGGWRSIGWLTRCAFFVLGLIAMGSLCGIFEVLHVRHPGVVAGLIAVAGAQWLILRHRFFASGLEEVLDVGGLILIVFDLTRVPGELETALLAAAIFAVVGLKSLTPLFTTLAFVALSFALDAREILPASGPVYARHLYASVFCFGAAWIALGLGAIRFQRPSYDRMLDWLVVGMPLVGYVWSAEAHVLGVAVDYRHIGSPVQLVTPCMPIAFAIIALATGLRRRTHAPLVASMLSVACAAYELRRLTGLSLEVRLIVWGALAFLLAVALNQLLRVPRAGITSEKVTGGHGLSSLAELAGSAAMTPTAQPAAARGFEGAGGQFGGAGASGRW